MAVRSGRGAPPAGPAAVWIAVAALTIAVVPLAVEGQELTPISTPRGVELRVIDLSYGVQGSDAATLLGQIRDGGVVSFPYEYRWRYRTRRLASVAGRRTQHCAVEDITIELTVRATYPRWENRPEDASPELLEAWRGFERQLEGFWRERQDEMVEFAREARREVLRLEEGCPILGQITNDLVQRIHDRVRRRERERAEAGERTTLRFPPEGFADLVVAEDEAAEDPGGGEGPRGRRPPPLPPADRTVKAPSGGTVGIERVLVADVGPGGMLGAVAGLRLAGELDYLGAAGVADLEGRDSLTADAPFRFPAFTEVLVATVAAALEGEGVLDASAPIVGYLPELTPGLGSVAVRDLLAHRSGIDDARPLDTAWVRVLDDLDDRAIFTEPDVIGSYSRYDYPLAVRVLEAATGSSMQELADRFVLDPLGMTGTRLEPSSWGIPGTRTTARDLLTFGSALADETVSVAGPSSIEGVRSRVSGSSGSYFGGLWWDAPVDVVRLSMMCEAAPGADAVGFQVYPEQDVAVILWARARSSARVWPATVARIVLDDLGTKLGLGPEIYEPRALKGAADLQTDPRICDRPDWNPRRVSSVGAPVRGADWAGRYTNGDRLVTLEERDGTLSLTDDTPLQVARHEGDVHFATMGGIALYPLRLTTDASGRRYVVLHGRAYIHDDDRARR